MQVSLSTASSKNISQITFELLSLCRRERDDLSLIRECLRDLKGAIGRCARGEESLKLFTALLKAFTAPASNEVVTFVIEHLKREIGRKWLSGPLVSKELFFALTIAEDVASETDSLDSASETASTQSQSRSQFSRTSFTLPLLQVAIWSFGCWGWQGIFQESLCTRTQLIDLLSGFLMGPARSFALLALVKLASSSSAALSSGNSEEKQEIMQCLMGNEQERDIREAIIFIEQGVILDEVDEEEEEEESVHTIDEECMSSLSIDESPAEPSQQPGKSQKIGKLLVSIQEFLPQTGKLTIILANPSPLPFSEFSVALAAAGGFDFDYMQAADRSVLPGHSQMGLIISLKRRTEDLLQFDGGEGHVLGVNYGACRLKVRIQYKNCDGETETHISPLQFV
jgi:hypothetical protein